MKALARFVGPVPGHDQSIELHNLLLETEQLSAARIALITAVCWRMNRWRVRWSIRQLCCSGVLVSTNRMFALVTASQMASASAASFLCRFTYPFTSAAGIPRTVLPTPLTSPLPFSDAAH